MENAICSGRSRPSFQLVGSFATHCLDNGQNDVGIRVAEPSAEQIVAVETEPEKTPLSFGYRRASSPIGGVHRCRSRPELDRRHPR